MRALYLIKRGLRPEMHRAPFHPVIVCSRKHTAKWEAGSTDDRAWVWTHDARSAAEGWCLERWEGLDVVSVGVLCCTTLPDGTRTGFQHDRDAVPWTLLRGAVWWSDHAMPGWLRDRGAIEAPDDFTLHTISDDYGTCLLPHADAERLRERRYAKWDRTGALPAGTGKGTP